MHAAMLKSPAEARGGLVQPWDFKSHGGPEPRSPAGSIPVRFRHKTADSSVREPCAAEGPRARPIHRPLDFGSPLEIVDSGAVRGGRAAASRKVAERTGWGLGWGALNVWRHAGSPHAWLYLPARGSPVIGSLAHQVLLVGFLALGLV